MAMAACRSSCSTSATLAQMNLEFHARPMSTRRKPDQLCVCSGVNLWRSGVPGSFRGRRHSVTVRAVVSDGEEVEDTNSIGSGRRSRFVQQLSWKSNAAKTLVLASTTSVRLNTDRSVRCATTEEIDAEKELIEEDAIERMEKTLETVKGNFNSVRTGRASPNLLDRVEVEYYGTNVILKSIAQVTTPDGTTILIQPFDKSSLSSIEKAVIKSDVGLNPNNDGNVIRLNVPQLTTDRRKELLKLVSKLSEEGKVALRNVRRDCIKAYEKLEKEKKLSADNLKDLSDDMQKLTDDYVKKIDTLHKEKEKELITV